MAETRATVNQQRGDYQRCRPRSSRNARRSQTTGTNCDQQKQELQRQAESVAAQCQELAAAVQRISTRAARHSTRPPAGNPRTRRPWTSNVRNSPRSRNSSPGPGQLTQSRDELDRQQQELAAQRSQLDELAHQFERKQVELADQEAAHRQRATELDQRRQQLDQQQAQLQIDRDQLKQREQQTRDQRKHIAQQLRAQRAEQLAEIDQRRAELVTLAANDNSQWAAQLAEATTRIEHLQRTLDEAREKSQFAQETVDTLSNVNTTNWRSSWIRLSRP